MIPKQKEVVQSDQRLYFKSLGNVCTQIVVHQVTGKTA